MTLQIETVPCANEQCGRYELKANNVDIGVIIVIENRAIWVSGRHPGCERFAIKNIDRLEKILTYLAQFKEEKGFDEILIGNGCDDIADFCDEATWKKLGFEIRENRGFYNEITK